MTLVNDLENNFNIMVNIGSFPVAVPFRRYSDFLISDLTMHRIMHNPKQVIRAHFKQNKFFYLNASVLLSLCFAHAIQLEPEIRVGLMSH